MLFRSFPSTGDASVLWAEASKAAAHWHPLAIISLPLVGIIHVVNLLRFFWLDYLYGFLIGFLLPEFLLKQVI